LIHVCLAPDALRYLEAVERLMQRDPTIFTGSLFADNSYPLYAKDPRRFRRVNHFAGLGFVMTRSRYVDELRRTVWAGLQNWDDQVRVGHGSGPSTGRVGLGPDLF